MITSVIILSSLVTIALIFTLCCNADKRKTEKVKFPKAKY